MRLNRGIIASSLGMILAFSSVANAANEILGDFNGDGNQDAFNQPINVGETSSITAKAGNSIAGFHMSWIGTHPDIAEIRDWSQESYSAQAANLSSSPGDELLLLGHKQIILLHGEIITPIMIPKDVPNAIVSWNASGNASYISFELDIDPDNFIVSFADFDGDGDKEIFLQNKSSGGDSYIVTGDGVISQTLYNGYLGIDWSVNSTLVFTDENGDGNIDIQVTDADGNVAVAYGASSGTLSEVIWETLSDLQISAGEDYSQYVFGTQTSFSLDGAVKYNDADISSIKWTQESGPTVNILESTTLNASFLAGNIADLDTTQAVVVKLRVEDANQKVATDTVTITLLPDLPEGWKDLGACDESTGLTTQMCIDSTKCEMNSFRRVPKCTAVSFPCSGQ